MSCRDVRDWLHRSAESLDESQRLVLDDHLAACARCRGDRARMRLLHQVGTSLQVPPPQAREYNRAIARALLEGGVRAAPPAPRRWALPFAIATAAAAAVIAISWIALRSDRPAPTISSGEHPPAPVPAPDRPRAPEGPAPNPTHAPAAADVVESGTLREGATEIASGGTVPANTVLHAAEPARLRLASARVIVAASAELRWLPAERTILLERGSLELETAPDGVARVVTARFEVQLDDASLTVEPTAVRVRRGTARIVDRVARANARATIVRLEAGGAWSPPATRDPRTPSAAQLLAQARARFAARDHAAAERAAETALASAPSRAEAAEAHALLADVAQAAGRLPQAVARYATVAAKFADLPAAESALYAAARLELRQGRTAEARALLVRYLDRYPSGRYASDARRQLTSIPAPGARP